MDKNLKIIMQKISIVIPVYNTKEYLPKLIECLKNQSYGNIELVFVNDGSTDGSGEFLKQQFKDYKNVKILENKTNKGTLYSRYYAFKNCTGDYICCIDSDDFISNNFIESAINYAITNNCDVVMTQQVPALKTQNGYEILKTNNIKIEQFWQGKNCLMQILNIDDVHIPYLFLRMLIKSDIIKNILSDIHTLVMNAGHITMGEDIVYALLTYYYCSKVGICYKSEYYYVKRDDQTVSIKSKEELLYKFESLIKSIKIVKDVLVEKNVYNQYKELIYKFTKNWQAYYFTKFCKYNCFNFSEDIIKKYMDF